MKAKATFLLAALVGAASQALAESTVYVPLGSAGEVLVIDVAQDRVVGSIGGVEDVHGLASVPGGEYLVAGSYSETTPDQPVLPAKPEGISEEEHQPHHSAAGCTCVAALDRGAVSFVSVIRTDERAVVRHVEVPGAVHHTAVTPDGRYAVATHPSGGGISVIDLSAFKVVTTVETGPLPNYVVVSSDGKRVYVSNAGNDSVSEIDTEGWIVRRSFVTGSSPEHMVLSPDDGTLYVNNVDAGTVSAIDLERGEVAETYTIGGVLHGIDLSDDGRTLFVAARELDMLIAIELGDGHMRSLALDPSPYHLIAVRGAAKLYISSAEEPKIWVVDQKSLQTLGEIPIQGKGHQMVIVER